MRTNWTNWTTWAAAVVAFCGLAGGAGGALIGTVDYGDSFTLTASGGNPGRVANVFPIGLPGINVENVGVNPAQAWTNSKWSISADAVVTNGGTIFPGGSGRGSATGMTQTGGGGVDWGLSYGLRNDYVIQTDFVQTADRIDLTTGTTRDTIFDNGNISVFFRNSAATPQIGIFNPAVGEKNTNLTSGIAAGTAWHNYALHVQQAARNIEVYVDQVYRGSIDLDTVSGGAFAGVPLSNAAVGTGYAGGDRGWSDNFQVGSSAVPVRGVSVGASTLIGSLDYSDSYTLTNKGGLTGRVASGAIEPAQPVENAHGHAARNWSAGMWSFSNDGNVNGGVRGYSAPSEAGSATGMTQRGGTNADWGIEYGLRRDFVVQTDMVQTNDRIDIIAGGSRDSMNAANGLAVFFRKAGTGLPQIGVYSTGIGEKDTGLTTGIVNNNEWHNYAVRFNMISRQLEFFVDQVSRGTVSLDTIGAGAFDRLPLSNKAVSVGYSLGGGDDRGWSDNFQVGSSVAFQPQTLPVFEVKYRDTFTINPPARPNGLYNNNATGGYTVEQTFGPRPVRTWAPLSNFSFNTASTSTNPALLAAATGNPGAAGGFAQSGGNDFSFAYGEAGPFFVSLDAILPSDRLDISSLPAAGANIFAANSLSVFFRRDSSGLPAIGLFNGATETGVLAPGMLGVNDNNWHNYAVWFAPDLHELGIYVDRQLVSSLDLTTFAGGIYENYSHAAVGAGGSGGVFWVDNFTVGAVPEPATMTLLALAAAAVGWYGRRRRIR